MPRCQFTSHYYDYETRKEVDFNCTEEEPLASGFCIFHDKDYLLQDKTNYEEHKRKVLERLKSKVNYAISNNEPLFCIGFHLPDFSLSDLDIISKEFTKPVYFSRANFQQEADFSVAKFQAKANFIEVTFQREAFFQAANFEREAFFNNAKFQREANFYQSKFKKGKAEFYRGGLFDRIL